MLSKIWSKIVSFFKNISWKSLLLRLKPRLKTRWIVTFTLWLIVIGYLFFGVYASVLFYKKHSTGKMVHVLAQIYPLPAALVNGNMIWAKDYYLRYDYITRFYQKTNTAYTESDIKNKIMDQLVEKRVIEWEATKNGIRVSSQDVEDVYNKIAAEKGEVELQKVLYEMYGMNEKEFKELLKTEIYAEKVQNELIEQVRLQHVLVKNEAKANEVANKAKSGEAFDQLAKTYSEDSKTRDSSGELGWIARGSLYIDTKAVPEFEEAAFKAKTNEIFGPVKTAAGFEIGRVEEKKGKVQKSYAQWLDDLKKEAKVVKFL